MRRAHARERQIGIDYYVSATDGIGGRLKAEPGDFRVAEIEGISVRPLQSDAAAFPHLIVRATLTGWDTYAFARRLARALGIHHEQVRWAGTKDKEAITTQLFSIEDVDPEALPEIRNAAIEPVGRFGRGLHFGDLLGNRFQLRVREPTHPDRLDRITEDLTSFGDGTPAVPNFFGPQRFGSIRPVTHRVGLAMLAGEWEAAVMRYLGDPTDAEPDDTRSARAFLEETQDWEGALERFPRRLDHERRILHALVDAGSGADRYREALEVLPDSLRQLFVHAAQSYAFNCILSERLSRELPFTAAIEGDVVCFAADTEALGPVPDSARTQRVTAERVETVNRHVRNGRAFVTAPLVGTETELGDGKPGAIERRVLDDLGLDRSDFDLPQPYASSGTRRAILLRTDLDVAHRPLTFAFALPSGAYATVVMREYLKGDPVRST